MCRLALYFSMVFALNANAEINNDSDSLCVNNEQNELEKLLFANAEGETFEIFDINSIEIVELEEEVELGFNTENYLPKNFNALKGMYDLDWSTIELIELEENVEFNFDTKDYLPKNFNVLKGMYDLDWSTIELIELEENIELNFDTKDYLPNNFDPKEGMHSTKIVACHY